MDKITEQYASMKLIFDKNLDQILKDIEKSKLKQSIKAIFRQQDKIEKLTKVLLDLENTLDNFYSIQAITRLIIEHFIVGHYIFISAHTSKSDKVGEEYYMQYEISEFFKRENYELAIEGIKENKKKNNTFENIILKYPKFSYLQEGNIQEIHKTAKQFDVRDIFNYFFNVNSNNHFNSFHQLLISTLSEYNQLSSYVHGGPLAEIETYEDILNTNKEERMKNCVKSAKIYSRTMKEHVFILLMLDMPEYSELLHSVLQSRQNN